MRSRTPRTSDLLGRYYTPDSVASALVELLAIAAPRLVVDLGAGSGALTKAAHRYWPSARYVTADLDPEACCTELGQTRAGVFEHYKVNVLAPELEAAIQVDAGSADVVLCNPPYLQLQGQPHFEGLLERAGLGGTWAGMSELPAELLFIAQSLQLLRAGGTLGLILPSGVVCGERCAPFRKRLLEEFRLIRVVELPRDTFQKTSVQAFLLVLVKESPSASPVQAQRLSSEGVLSPPVPIPAESRGERMDYSYWSQRLSAPSLLRDAVLSVCRGPAAPHAALRNGLKVFHTTDFQAPGVSVPLSFLNACAPGPREGAYAQEGDVLIARLGRNLATKVAYVPYGFVVPTDFVWIVRPAAGQSARVLASLLQARDVLDTLICGAGAKFLTKDALLSLPLSP